MPTWKSGALWVLATSGLLAIAASGKALPGQSGSDASRPAIPAADNSWPKVNLNVVVLDKHGDPQTVDEHQFQLFEDGAERPLDFRGSPDSPVSIAFIIDNSGSVYGRLGSSAAVVNTILKGLPEGSEMMSVSFNDTAYVDLPFTPVTDADLSFLGRMDSRGRTSLYDAVIATEIYFGTHARYVRRAIVLLSDGGDDSSQSTKADAIRSLEWPGAPTFYSFLPPVTEVSGVATRHDKLAMELFARAGGGVSFAPKEKDFTPAVTRLAAIIRSQYVLRFTAADPARDGSAHKLEVRLPIKDAQIYTLPVYFAPAK